MPICSFRRRKIDMLCPSDLTHLTTICERKIVGDAVHDDEQDATDLVDVMQAWAAVSTASSGGGSPFARAKIFAQANEINISELATHRVSYRYTDLVGLIFDTTKHIILIGGVRLRITSAVNLDMNNKIIDCYCAERGPEQYRETQA